MKILQLIVSVLLLITLSGICLSVQAQRRRSPRRSPTHTNRAASVNTHLTGTYHLDRTRSDDARAAADRATINLPAGDRQRVIDNVMPRLESPAMLAIEQRGRTVTIASSNAPGVMFDADGRERAESGGNGRTVRSRATLNGDRLDISSYGDRRSDFSVSFESLDNGRRLGVTRQIFVDLINQPIVVQSFYDKVSNTAQIRGDKQAYAGGARSEPSLMTFLVPNGTRLMAVLNNDLSTEQSASRDPFTSTVREPAQYSGATINGYVSRVNQSGKVTGRSEMTLNFEHIRLSNGRTYRFAGPVESVRTNSGQSVRVDNEGNVESSSQTEKTGERAAIGGGVGAIIGAIAGGGKGAAIGAILGGGAGAGSVYAQGQENLELRSGTELTIRASAPGKNQ